MLCTLKRQCRVLWQDWVFWGAGLIPEMGLFGFVLYQILFAVAKDVGAYVPLGTVIAAFAAVLFAGTLVITQLGLYFNIEVSMGCLRSHFFFSYVLCAAVASLIGWVYVLLICMAENALNRWLHPMQEVRVDILPYLLKWGMPAMILVIAAALLCGTLLIRFGRWMRILLLTVWIVLCIGFPQFMNAVEEAPDSIFGQIGSFLADLAAKVPAGMWGLAGLSFTIAAFAVSYLLLRRQQVTA